MRYAYLALILSAGLLIPASADAQVTTTGLSSKGTLTVGQIITSGTTATVLYAQQTGTTGAVRGIITTTLFDAAGWGPLDTGVLAGLNITQTVATSGSPSIITVTGGLHTTLAASTELADVVFNLNRNVQFTAGTLTTNRSFIINAPTLSFSSTSTLTTAATAYISGPPIEGTNNTMVRAYGLMIDSGATTASNAAGLVVHTPSNASTTGMAAAHFAGRVSIGQNAATTMTADSTLVVDVYQYGGSGISLRNSNVAIGSWSLGAGGAGSIIQLNGQSNTLATQIGRGDNYFNADMAAVNILMSGDTMTNLLVVNGTNDRVGIGTASPTTLLDVNGAVNVSGGIFVTGTGGRLDVRSTSTTKLTLGSVGTGFITVVDTNPSTYMSIISGYGIGFANVATVNVGIASTTDGLLKITNGTTTSGFGTIQTGGFAANFRALTTTGNITVTDNVVTLTMASGTTTTGITAFLPSTSITGQQFIVKNIGSVTSTVSVVGGTKTIDGATTQAIVSGAGKTSAMQFTYDGVNYIISE